MFANVLIRLDVLLTEASSRMNSSLQSDWKNTNCNTNYKNKVVIIKWGRGKDCMGQQIRLVQKYQTRLKAD